MHRARSLIVLGLLAAAACAEPPVTPSGMRSASGPGFIASTSTRYVLLTTGDGPSSSDIASAGGTLTASYPDVGVAIASSDDPAFAQRAQALAGVQTVAEDVMLDFQDPMPVVDAGDAIEPGALAHAVGAHETFRGAQWNVDAVRAPGAWQAGYQGQGVRVAILDGGIRSTHIDLAPALDVAASRSFVPGQPFDFDQRRGPPPERRCELTDTFWHGTHVAGIVGARANSLGTVGVAPQATLIGVKVLHCGSGSFSWIIEGIIYAARPAAEGGAGAHVINMSLGAGFVNAGPGAAALTTALGRATNYAYQRGVTIIAAAGNDAVDIDHTANITFVPAQSPHVIAVSATAPVGFALGSTNFDVPTTYTNFGQSAITLAGPGGDDMLPGNDVCVRGNIQAPCWVFDLVLSTCRGAGGANGNYCFAAGTSMASPAVAGVAAIILSKYPGASPAQVEARLRASADDLGKPGNDDFYGRGRVNALRAIQ